MMQLAEDRFKISSLFLIDMPLSILWVIMELLSIMHHGPVVINASSSSLIDMPISMPLINMAILHFFRHH